MQAHSHTPNRPKRGTICAQKIALLFVCATFCGCIGENPQSHSTYLPLNDTEYPYAGVPRIVIETEGFQEIRDNETEIPAKLQIWGKNAPESEVLNLTIRGRGNSSFMMTKYSLKLEFFEKQKLFGMPANKDWNLISNFRDKTHLRNYITFLLAESLGDYATRSCFTEIYLNRQYLGLYLFTESVKVGKNRVNIPKNDSSFLIEKTRENNAKENLFTTNRKYLFELKYPKKPSQETIQLVKSHFNDFESYLKENSFTKENPLTHWIDIESFLRYYWIQEFSKNRDGNFGRSIFITWEKGGLIKMGPVWDFDLAYGIWNFDTTPPSDWFIRHFGWYGLLFDHESFENLAKEYWKNHRGDFLAITSSIDSLALQVRKAVLNDEKRWPILKNDDSWPFVDKYESHEEAVYSLQSWMTQRIKWMDENL